MLTFHHLKSSKKAGVEGIARVIQSAKSTEANSSISNFFSGVIPPEVMQVFHAAHFKHVFIGND